MTKGDKFYVGDLVKMKSDHELRKLGVSPAHDLHDDVGVIVQVVQNTTQNYVVVRWQKAEKEIHHFSSVLDKVI